MGLEEYQKKRNFDKTSEPFLGDSETGENVFVIQEHNASSHHFDFRLAMKEDFLDSDKPKGAIVLKSWAIPKTVPVVPGEKRLAVMTEDHPVQYLNFEGEIPKGEYGAGSVKIWDKGDYQVLSQSKNSFKIHLNGKKINGNYALVNAKFTKENQWLIFKVD